MKKILLIDDSEYILDSTSALLRFEGYDVFTASDGKMGIETVKTNKPDMVLCDIAMPVLDGFGVLQQIRARTETETLPFIFLTAFSEKSNMRAGMALGADDFIIKPFTRDELISAINAQWEKHSRIERQFHEKVEEMGRSVTSVLPHEFRTALNEVIGTAKYLNTSSDSVSSEEIVDLTNDIMTSANRLLKITENFLIFVGIEAFGSNPIKKAQLRTFRTDEPAAIFLDIASSKAERTNRQADLIFEENAEQISVEISSESFYKIADELLDNAFRFSDPGTKIIIKSYVDSEMLHVTIKDHGRGMTKEQINNISALAQFDRTFYEQQGVGLGLIIAKKLIELHDGTFRIDSTEGVGTTINFSLHCDGI